MTRDEAKQDIINYQIITYDASDYVITVNDAIDTINQVYDGLESRNCGNCKYNKKEDGFMIFCDSVMCQDGSKMMWHSFTKDFCCNKWESK